MADAFPAHRGTARVRPLVGRTAGRCRHPLARTVLECRRPHGGPGAVVPDRGGGRLRAGGSGGVRRGGAAARGTGRGLRGVGAARGSGPAGGDGARGSPPLRTARARRAAAAPAGVGQGIGHGGRTIRPGRGHRGPRPRAQGRPGVAGAGRPGHTPVPGPRPAARHPAPRWGPALPRHPPGRRPVGPPRHRGSGARRGAGPPRQDRRPCRAARPVRCPDRLLPGRQAPSGRHEDHPGVRASAAVRSGPVHDAGGRGRRQGRGLRGGVRDRPDRAPTARAIGYTAEYDLSLWLTKARALRTAWGGPARCRAVVLGARG